MWHQQDPCRGWTHQITSQNPNWPWRQPIVTYFRLFRLPRQIGTREYRSQSFECLWFPSIECWSSLPSLPALRRFWFPTCARLTRRGHRPCCHPKSVAGCSWRLWCDTFIATNQLGWPRWPHAWTRHFVDGLQWCVRHSIGFVGANRCAQLCRPHAVQWIWQSKPKHIHHAKLHWWHHPSRTHCECWANTIAWNQCQWHLLGRQFERVAIVGRHPLYAWYQWRHLVHWRREWAALSHWAGVTNPAFGRHFEKTAGHCVWWFPHGQYSWCLRFELYAV